MHGRSKNYLKSQRKRKSIRFSLKHLLASMTLVAIGLTIQAWLFRHNIQQGQEGWYVVPLLPVSGGIIGWGIALPFQSLPVTYWTVVAGLFLRWVAPLIAIMFIYGMPAVF
jgi:hypothetical protein